MSAVLEDATMPGTADFPDPLSLARDLIRFPTVNPPGREKACMEFVGDLLARHGVPVEFYAHDPERPNLVARIRGRGEAPPLLLYGHLDVVSTEGQDWSVPPFEGIVKDGFLWGRGALDMKGGVAMLLSAFLHATRQAPPGDLILALLSDEETGGQYGAAHLVAHHSALFEGVRHAVGEFGAFTLILGGLRFFPIQIAEKRHCKLDLVFRAHGGHAAAGCHRLASLRQTWHPDLRFPADGVARGLELHVADPRRRRTHSDRHASDRCRCDQVLHRAVPGLANGDAAPL